MSDDRGFSGTKIALIHRGALVAYLRDDKPEIPFPGMWDLPGGGREGDESPVACALREVEEEFGLALSELRVSHLSCRRGTATGRPAKYFCVATLTDEDVAAIRFGDEGQRWAMMPIQAYLDHPSAIPELKAQLRAYLAAAGASPSQSRRND